MVEEVEGEIIQVSERSILSYPKIGEAVRTVAVTYSTPDLPPRTLWIPESEYSEEHRNELIKKDLEKRRSQPRTEVHL